ncbi:hypothetical protein AJ90_19310 [Vibrio parahaemolyticus M0605]|nr:hypothetical protein AJ90_19310 [Vibrio parahaemolyticus M0605]
MGHRLTYGENKMFKGFELTLSESDFLSNYGLYSELLRKTQEKIADKFNEVLLNDGKINADKIMEEWFPSGQYHVFISHSHKDLELAEQLANWLYEKFKLTSFLDSHVWGYANNLLKDLNEKYARNGEETYAYEPAISNAAHVYLMLSTALAEVIDKSECLFFINTENALENMQIEGSQAKSRTASPWIMHELKTSAMIRRRYSSDREESVTESAGLESLEKSAGFSFSVPTEHLFKLDQSNLSKWAKDCCVEGNSVGFRRWLLDEKKEFDALDVLYTLSMIDEDR